MFNKNNILIGVFGAGGFAREVMPFAKAYVAARYAPDNIVPEIVFVETEPGNDEVNGYTVLSEADFIRAEAGQKLFNIAIASSKDRENIANRLCEAGCHPISLFAASATVYDNNIIGEGACICASVTITSNARIGKHFHANLYAYVAHDCEIGDYVTFAPRVSCNGNVRIENHAYIGTGAIIKQGRPGQPTVIGEGAVVGMGAVVTKDVAPFTTVIGNPARILEKK